MCDKILVGLAPRESTSWHAIQLQFELSSFFLALECAWLLVPPITSPSHVATVGSTQCPGTPSVFWEPHCGSWTLTRMMITGKDLVHECNSQNPFSSALRRSSWTYLPCWYFSHCLQLCNREHGYKTYPGLCRTVSRVLSETRSGVQLLCSQILTEGKKSATPFFSCYRRILCRKLLLIAQPS